MHIYFSSFVLYVFLFLLGVICHYPCIFGNFVFDDRETVINNPDVTGQRNWISSFQNDFWGNNLTHNSSHKSYRPLTVLSYRFNVWIEGQINPLSFHVINIMLHGINCMLILKVYSDIVTKPWSLVGASLFAVHPINTEAVCAIVGRADLLCALFTNLSLWAYKRHMCHSSRQKCLSMLLCFISAVFALLSKEQGIMALCVGYEYLFRTVMLFFMTLLLLHFRLKIMEYSTPTFSINDNPSAFMDSKIFRILNYNYIYSINSLLLIYPHWLCFDWSMGCIPVIKDEKDYRICFVFVFWATCYIWIQKLWKCQNFQQRQIAFVSLLMFISFLPSMNIFFTVGFVVAERNLYFPALGFCLIVSIGYQKLASMYPVSWKNLILKMCIVYLICIFFIKSLRRSGQWVDEGALFPSDIAVCPWNAKIHYNIAKLFGDSGNSLLSEKYYKSAISLNPRYEHAMNNLANIYKDRGMWNEAKDLLLQAIHLRSDFAAAWMNLGIVEISLKHPENAEKAYFKALELRPKYADCYFNLGNLYLEENKKSQALAAWEKAVALKPDHKHAWINKIIYLDTADQCGKAVVECEKGLALLPNEAGLHFACANCFGKIDQYEQSEKHFHKAIALQPGNPTYATNLGETEKLDEYFKCFEIQGILYHRWKKYDLAKEMYQYVLSFRPDYIPAQKSLSILP